VKIALEDGEDSWVLYTVLQHGDLVQGESKRKVQVGSGLDPGRERVRVRVALRVEEVSFDGESDKLRVRGRNERESEYVPMGSYHALELGPGDETSVTKEEWDKVDWSALREASKPDRGADALAVLIREGLAFVCSVSPSRTAVKAKVKSSMPRKRGTFSEQARMRSVAKFTSRVVQQLENVAESMPRLRAMVIAGPGRAKDDLAESLNTSGPLGRFSARNTVIRAHLAEPFPQNLPQLLAQQGVANFLEGARASKEAAALERWHKLLADSPARAAFGPSDVQLAHANGAIAELLITDLRHSSKSPEERSQWRELADSVKATGGAVHILSSAHSTGQRLEKLSGVAASLRFPLPELEI